MCPSGFEGLQCQFQTNCQLICKNGGVCNSTGNGCICPSEYNGLDCSNLISRCLLNPCLNGAQCINRANNSYLCNCTSGFAGYNCEIPITPCYSSPCGQNGVCQFSNSSAYRCNCFYPFSGVNCGQRLTLCNFINCGQGNCVLNSTDGFDARCECFTGYTGQYCNLRLEGQGCSSSPCRNGARCIDYPNGSYSCNCANEFSGTNCENSKHSFLSNYLKTLKINV